MVAKVVGEHPPKESYAVAYAVADCEGIKKDQVVTFKVKGGWHGGGVGLSSGLLVDLHGIGVFNSGLRATRATPVRPGEVSHDA